MKMRSLLMAAFLPALAACQTAPVRSPAPPAPRVAGTLTGQAPLDAADGVPGSGRALAVTYLSTDGVTGSGLVPVTGEVIYPPGPPPPGGWPIVAWAHGTVGIAAACAPSRNPHSLRDQDYLGAWLRRGFAIVATDYQGLGGGGTHPYLNARAEAYSVLDGVRAALSGLPDLRDTVMIVGQSQGAGAAFAAASYAPAYAPTLDIRGTVATGIPYMTPEIAKSLMHGGAGRMPKGQVDPVVAYALLIAASAAGLDPAFDPAAAFTPRAMRAFHAASQTCLSDLLDIVRDDGLTRANSFRPTLPHALAPALRAMAFPTLKLAAPLFVGTGAEDRDVAPLGQLLLVRDACRAGTTVQAHLYKGLDHGQTVMASLADSAAFTRAVMTGAPVTPDCAPVARAPDTGWTESGKNMSPVPVK
ncbi:lipase family protein [Gluconacetobacter takamatsuzukensis]|uniref:Alpha/beta hydrolase n=1 Tax=Gluconacetobacter takamatsuzukensis TaxID=1286190 RepID=A0A7W4KEB2_9PROT|nr:lipase family protein [Gluconacetobacter takamatsuzukensis]MBB2205352.1 alpha/beta hydrolase [Gluconacetobacter takamatsuzukensis]